MRKKNHKNYKFTYIKTTLAVLFFCLLFIDGYVPFERTGENYFHIRLNGREIGTVGDRESAERLLIAARRNVASGSSELVFMETELELSGEEVLWGIVDEEKDILARMEEVLQGAVIQTMHRSYTMKVNDYIVSLAGIDEVQQLLQTAIDRYDSEGAFEVSLVYDNSREFSVLTAAVEDTSDPAAEEKGLESLRGGIADVLRPDGVEEAAGMEMGFGDYALGIQSMDFEQKVEIVEAYLPESQLTPLAEATECVVMEQETAGVYEVVSGDTLSEIAIKVNIPMDKIIEMNDSLEDERTTLRIGQQLVITVPEPVLSVTRVEQNYYEEIYDAEVVIIDVDDWYTTQTEVLQQPSAGFRKVVADVSFVNDKEVSREILKEEIVMEAVPKIMKRGTKIPPTYVKPISGGRLTSNFGPRKAPTKGASSYHKGVDWATPIGTPVYASCGGTVAKAGWGSGYGYVIYINHEDGRQTRYGHLSKVLVKAGQSVKQGDKIALSGNTGVSTGPHIHFEILINGKQVNPLNYLD